MNIQPTPISGPYFLQDLKDFPYMSWSNQLSVYTALKSWYDGDFLNATVPDASSGTEIEKYPVKINPLRGTCEKHAVTLFGQTLDSIRYSGIPIKILPKLDKEDKVRSEKIVNALSKVFDDNGMGGLFVSNGKISQYLGGCVFAANYNFEQKRIISTAPSPKDVYLIPEGLDYWNIREAWIVKEITYDVAKSYIPKIPGSETDKYYYIEHWTKTTYSVQVNGVTIETNGVKAEGAHPYGIVPIMYIPHIREDKFLGESIITEMVKGLIREINMRTADIGDAVSDDSHKPIFIRNIRGALQMKEIDGRKVIDLGSGTNLAGNEAQPDMDAVAVGTASTTMIDFEKELYKMYRREVSHPAVADGEDEGSQRSSLTLTTRMWPLVSHVELERVFWSIGISKFCKILLTMMEKKKLFGITKEDVDVELTIEWAPMLPVNRTELVNEVTMRAKDKLGSKKHLLELLGDTRDVDEELALIEQEAQKAAELLQKTNAAKFGASNSGGPAGTEPGAKKGNTPVKQSK